jgi:hypothetical protein
VSTAPLLPRTFPRARSQLLLNTMVVDAGNLDGKPKRRFRRSELVTLGSAPRPRAMHAAYVYPTGEDSEERD